MIEKQVEMETVGFFFLFSRRDDGLRKSNRIWEDEGLK